MSIKYLPSGSMRSRQWVGRLEGFAAALLIGLVVKATVISMEPQELSRPIRPTIEPLRGEIEPAPPRLRIAPCSGAGKDCVDVEADPTRSIPEPGTLFLIIGGLIAVVLTRMKK